MLLLPQKQERCKSARPRDAPRGYFPPNRGGFPGPPECTPAKHPTISSGRPYGGSLRHPGYPLELLFQLTLKPFSISNLLFLNPFPTSSVSTSFHPYCTLFTPSNHSLDFCFSFPSPDRTKRFLPFKYLPLTHRCLIAGKHINTLLLENALHLSTLLGRAGLRIAFLLGDA